jgi:hypothetical protein
MRNTPRLCKCNCGRTCSGRSTYFSDECRWRVAYQKRKLTTFIRCAEDGCQEPRHGRSKYCLIHCRHTGHRPRKEQPSDILYKQSLVGVHIQHKAVEIIDPKSDRHDFISMKEWHDNESAYLSLGCRAIVKGQEMLL